MLIKISWAHDFKPAKIESAEYTPYMGRVRHADLVKGGVLEFDVGGGVLTVQW